MILTRKPQESFIITTLDGQRIVVKVVEVQSPNRVRLGIEAPECFRILRAELENCGSAQESTPESRYQHYRPRDGRK